MDGLILRGAGDIASRTDLADPTIVAPTDALVRVELAGLCGSDLHPYHGRERVRADVTPGHETLGEVVATGDGVARLQPGDRVVVPFTTSCGHCAACRRGLTARCADGQLFGYGDPDHLEVPALQGAHAQQLRVPLADTTAVAAPPGVDDRVALLLTDNLPTAWEAVQRAAPAAGEPMIVVGLGAVGLCAVAAARAVGADPIIGVDPVAGRRELAQQLGADTTITPDDARSALTGGAEGRHVATAGAIVEAAGASAAQRLAFDLLRPGGVVSIIAVQTDAAFPFTPVEAYDRNATVRVGRASVRTRFDEVLEALASGALTADVGRVLTHVGVPLADGPALYRRFADREDGLVKAAFSPNG